MTDLTENLEPSASWVLRSRDLLDRSAAELDGATLSRLNRARHAALDRVVGAPPRSVAVLGWFGATAVSAGLALVIWQGLWSTPPVAPNAMAPLPPSAPATVQVVDAPVAAPDFDLLSDADSYALLEDLEFYAWLEAEEGNGG